MKQRRTPRVAKAATMRAVAVGVAAVLLVGCGTESVTVGKSTLQTDAKRTTQSVAARTPSKLDLAELSRSADSTRYSHFKVLTTLTESGRVVPVGTMTFTIDRKLNTSKIVLAPNDPDSTPGLTEVSDGANMYVTSTTATKWTKLSLDPSLRAKVSVGDSSNIVALLANMGFNATRRGTAAIDGERVTEYAGPVDWGKSMRSLGSKSALMKQMFAHLPSDAHTSGTATVWIDDNGKPKRLVMTLRIESGSKHLVINETEDFLSTTGLDPVTVPSASEISATVPVHSYDDFQRTMAGIIKAS